MARGIDTIEALRPGDIEDYLAAESGVRRAALEHHIFIAIQAMVDIAAHIIASQGYGVPGTYREAVVKLGTEQVIDRQLAESLADAAGLRNAIAHAYLELDQERVFSALWKTDELKRFAAAVWEWVEGQ
jgi:uncharacterized protein YutE (UPF0331/DUF86 family)